MEVFDMKLSDTVTVDGQTIHLTGIANARQLGGYRGFGHKAVKKDLLLRSGAMTGAIPGDIRHLTGDLKLGTIIDLRTTTEIAAGPDPVIDGVNNIQLKILDEKSKINSAASVAASFFISADPAAAVLELARSSQGITAHTYSDILSGENARTGYRMFFRILLENTPGRSILWHCTGGKDRTGLAAAFLLSALGADRETILDDFELSNQFLAQNINYIVQKAAAYTNDEALILAVKNIVGVSREYMEQTLDDINRSYGSMDHYLREFLGLTDQEKNRLRELYLD